MSAVSRLSVTAAAMSLALSGCWMFSTGGGPAPEPDCEWTEQTLESGAEATAETVVMLDLSASAWTSESGQIPDYPGIVGELAVAYFREADVRTVTLGLFSGDASEIRFPMQKAPLARPLDQGQDEQLSQIRECVGRVLEEALEDPPVTPGSDILAAISAGSRRLTGAEHATLAIVTDGHSNVGCLDMNRVLAETDTEVLRERCEDESEWPGALPGNVDLRLIGVSGAGVPVEDGHSGAQALGRIREFWNRIGEQLTGVPGEYAEDPTHRWVDVPERDYPEDPPVLIREPGQDTLVIEAEALFDTDSAELKESAGSSVAAVVDSYGDALDRTAPVTVTGHTDSRGEDGYNDDLSSRRAEAVRRHLLGLGFTDVRAEGRGSAEPACNDKAVDGFNDECGRLNRRVEIHFEV